MKKDAVSGKARKKSLWTNTQSNEWHQWPFNTPHVTYVNRSVDRRGSTCVSIAI